MADGSGIPSSGATPDGVSIVKNAQGELAAGTGWGINIGEFETGLGAWTASSATASSGAALYGAQGLRIQQGGSANRTYDLTDIEEISAWVMVTSGSITLSAGASSVSVEKSSYGVAVVRAVIDVSGLSGSTTITVAADTSTSESHVDHVIAWKNTDIVSSDGAGGTI